MDQKTLKSWIPSFASISPKRLEFDSNKAFLDTMSRLSAPLSFWSVGAPSQLSQAHINNCKEVAKNGKEKFTKTAGF